MTSLTTIDNSLFLRDLGDGLILRRATPADAAALAAFNGRIHSDDGPDQPDQGVIAWTDDLLTRPHPTFSPGDFTIVENTQTGEIVSSVNLISQTWSYDGIPFGVGRPELVGTHPDYRRKGLVRLQFDVIHQWSAERGEMMQVITGIPYYYRQFGYEMCLSLDAGRVGPRAYVAPLKEGETEPYVIRPATEADLPFIAQVYARSLRRYPVACVRDEAVWRYELSGRSEQSVHHMVLQIIETPQGEPVGYLAHRPRLIWKCTVAFHALELKSGVSWLAVLPCVLRYTEKIGTAYAEADPEKKQGFTSFGFWLGTEHPVYEIAGERLPQERKPYGWYIRVPDLPGFIRHIAPALERRLAESPLAGHTGELKISFYRGGLRMVFEKGKLTAAEPWASDRWQDSGAGFPDLTFLHVVMGNRTPEELRYIFPDCRYTGEALALLGALFPKRTSQVWPVA